MIGHGFVPVKADGQSKGRCQIDPQLPLGRTLGFSGLDVADFSHHILSKIARQCYIAAGHAATGNLDKGENMSLNFGRAALAVGLVALSAVFATQPVFADAGPNGIWRLSSGKVTIRVNQCGGQNLCATIVGLAQPLNKKGQPKMDKNNPNPALQTRRLIGLQVVSGMKPAGANSWRGSIYNADDGRTYSGTATVNGNTLVIKACILGGLACKKRQFVRIN